MSQGYWEWAHPFNQPIPFRETLAMVAMSGNERIKDM